MVSRVRHAGALVLLASLTGAGYACSTPKPAPTALPPNPSDALAQPAPAVEKVLLSVALSNPERDSARVASRFQLPPEAQAVLMFGLLPMLARVLGRTLAEAVDQKAPASVVFGKDASMPVVALRLATGGQRLDGLDAEFEQIRVAPGIGRLVPRPHATDVGQVGERATCEIHAATEAPMLLCAPDGDALRRLAPGAIERSRGVKPDVAIRVELAPELVDRPEPRGANADTEQHSPAYRGALAVSWAWWQSLTRVFGELRFDGGMVIAALGVERKRDGSVIDLLLNRPPIQGELPSGFGELPSSFGLLAAARGADLRGIAFDGDPLWAGLKRGMDEAAADPPRVLEELRRALGAPIIFASGGGAAGAPSRKAKRAPRDAQAANADVTGYWLLGAPAEQGTWRQRLQLWTKTDPGVGSAAAGSRAARRLQSLPLRGQDELPQAAAYFQLSVKPSDSPPSRRETKLMKTWHLVTVDDAKRSWLVASMRRELAIAQARMLLNDRCGAARENALSDKPQGCVDVKGIWPGPAQAAAWLGFITPAEMMRISQSDEVRGIGKTPPATDIPPVVAQQPIPFRVLATIADANTVRTIAEVALSDDLINALASASAKQSAKTP